ncbi:MAG: trypsin-like peptidase domain-containing protein [Microvirga sp.]|nr:trypsin-like peptidase domain-containing protein [Microvirga sp.]
MQINQFGSIRRGLVGAAAVAALIAGAGLASGPQGSAPAYAEPLRLEQPVAIPGFADVVDRVKPAVVSVRVAVDAVRVSNDAPSPRGRATPDLDPSHPLYDFFRRFEEFGMQGPRGGAPEEPRGPRRGASQGSGFFISGDGYVVTNNHVVGTAEEVEIVTDDGRTLAARVVGVDPRTDLAVLKVDGEDDLPYVALAEGRSRIGEWVVAIGNPFGLGGTVTAGIVSAEARDIGAGPYDEFLQIDAPINRGNSGGPTFNLSGDVVGVNTAIYSQSGGNVGIAFAIPAHVVQGVVSQLIENGEVTRGFLGVQIQPVTPEIAEAIGLDAARGALVAQPQDGGPAARAGLRSGDVIVSVDGRAIEDHRDLSRLIAGYEPGSSASVEIMRRSERQVITVEIGRLDDA